MSRKDKREKGSRSDFVTEKYYKDHNRSLYKQPIPSNDPPASVVERSAPL